MDAEKQKRRGQGRNERKKRGKISFSVHPLFLALGIYYCFTGELAFFFLSALVALQHECAHAFAAAKLGYRLNKIVLMPYGAVVDGDLSGISLSDEIFVAAWGPLCNLFTAAGFAALWWFYPDAYAFTDTACFVSLAVGLVNLLPAYPLDGGRVLRCALAGNWGEKKAEKICRWVTAGFALLLFAAFGVLCARGSVNFTLLVFALFLAVGALGSGGAKGVDGMGGEANNGARYVKINFSSKEAFRRGVEIRRVAVTDSCTLKKAVGFLIRGKYLVLEIYDEKENFLGEIGQNELAEIFFSSGLYQKIGEFV